MDNKFAKKSLSMMAKKMIEMAKTYPEIGKRTPTKVISSFCIYKLSVFVPTQQSNFYLLYFYNYNPLHYVEVILSCMVGT
jgi:hypothetical protein